MSLIIDTLLLHLPRKHKTTPSGWISFNSPCCSDKRQRGGLIINDGKAVSYHCFNCNFKASWQPGRQLSKNMKSFMQYLGMNDTIINKLSLEALRSLNDTREIEPLNILPKFIEKPLPEGATPIIDFIPDVPHELVPVLDYLQSRKLFLEDYPFYWSPLKQYNNRLIIPFYYNKKIVGYTARSVVPTKTRYLADQQPGYVFNLDNQTHNREFVIVCEGPIDAISIDGCAILGSDIKEQQDTQLKQLKKEIVLVPDRDHEGPKTIEKALEFGWSVSMPQWPPGIKDINDAVIKLGRLATLWMIASSTQSNQLKIKLAAKQWFK